MSLLATTGSDEGFVDTEPHTGAKPEPEHGFSCEPWLRITPVEVKLSCRRQTEQMASRFGLLSANAYSCSDIVRYLFIQFRCDLHRDVNVASLYEALLAARKLLTVLFRDW